MSEKYFYLHIPKTAGTTFNNFLKKNFSSSNVIFHIESKLDKIKDQTVLSGHIPLVRAEKVIPNFDEYIQITVFREPLKQLSSHLRYVRKLGEPREKSRLLTHTPQIQKIVARLVLTDLSSTKELENFIVWLEEENLALFHNTQTQYLIGSRFEITTEMLEGAKFYLEKIEYVGITERLDDYMRLLRYRLKLHRHHFTNKKLNVTSESFGLNIEQEEIQKVLEPLICYDKIIYDEAKHRFSKDFFEIEGKIPKSFHSFLDKIRTIIKG